MADGNAVLIHPVHFLKIFFKSDLLVGKELCIIYAHKAVMPRLVDYASNVLLALGIAEDKTIIRCVLPEPLVRLSILEAVVVHINIFI